jgi:hypothetical protein
MGYRFAVIFWDKIAYMDGFSLGLIVISCFEDRVTTDNTLRD